MDEIERLRERVRAAEISVANMRGLAEHDERHMETAKDPDALRARNADRIKEREEILSRARKLLEDALANSGPS